MIKDFHPEIQTYIKSKLLKSGDIVIYDGKEAIFDCLPYVAYGRLGAPCVEPGKYLDRTNALVTVDTVLNHVEISSLVLGDTLLERVKNLPPEYYLISLAEDKVAELPETDILESDIVRLTDKDHDYYSDDPNKNQFTVNRIDFSQDPIQFKLKAGATVFRVSENQITRCGDGPVRIFYGGESFKLIWPSAKAEAEFYCLLGRYLKAYNPASKSYYWDLETAKQMVALGRAQGILDTKNGYNLINFWDTKVGQELSRYPDTILDI